MLAGALTIFKYLAVVGGISLVAVLFAPFMLSSRISREEEAEEYRILLRRLQKLRNLNAANDAAAHQESPVRAVES